MELYYSTNKFSYTLNEEILNLILILKFYIKIVPQYIRYIILNTARENRRQSLLSASIWRDQCGTKYINSVFSFNFIDMCLKNISIVYKYIKILKS